MTDSSGFMWFWVSAFSLPVVIIWSTTMKNCLNWNNVSSGFLFYNVCTYFGSPSGCLYVKQVDDKWHLVSLQILKFQNMKKLRVIYTSNIYLQSKQKVREGTLQRQQMNSAASWSWSLWQKAECHLCKGTQNWQLWLLKNIKKPYKEVYLL